MTDEDATGGSAPVPSAGGRTTTPPPGATRRLGGATVGMAIGTTLSRLTGVGRVVAMTAAVSGGAFADAYNLANTTPNIVTDIVIGGVLAATFVPVFVSELTTRSADAAWEAISAVVTVTVAVIGVATLAFLLFTPSIIDLYTATNHHADVHQQQVVATFLLRLFVPQLACYGLIALASALLNTQGRFALPMFVPIANNLVVIGILVWFHGVVPHPSLSTLDAHHSAVVVLGVGTTLGVVVQALCLVPSLLRSELRIRFRWQPGHEAVLRITRLAGWTFGIVVSNQLALVVVLALADGARMSGAVSAWTYAYTFFQLPYGVIGVSIMSAVTPSLSALWAEKDLVAFRRRMAYGLRSVLALVIPSAVGMLVLAHPLIDLVLAHGAETASQASTTAATLAMFALGLPGFCSFLYLVRVLQAMQDTRTAFLIYLIENGLNIVLAVVLVGPMGVRGLALSLSIAYSVAALIALSVVAGRDDGLGGRELTTPVTRVLVSTGVMAVVTVLVVNVSAATSGVALLGRVILAVAAGAIAFVGTAAVLAARLDSREAARRTVANAIAPDTMTVTERPYPGRAGPSIRLITVDDEDSETETTDRVDLPPDGPFRDRLEPGSDPDPVRHVRLQSGRPGDVDDVVPEGDRNIGRGPAEEPEARDSSDDEE